MTLHWRQRGNKIPSLSPRDSLREMYLLKLRATLIEKGKK
jgi:hypothetical protein